MAEARVTLTLSPKLAAYLDMMVDEEEGWGVSRDSVATRLMWDGVHAAVERGLICALEDPRRRGRTS